MRLKPLNRWITSNSVFDWFVWALWMGLLVAEQFFLAQDDRMLSGLFGLILTVLVSWRVLGHATEPRPAR